MQIEAFKRSWQIKDLAVLNEAMDWRDSRGGAEFWLSDDDSRYPCLVVRVTGALATVHFFPEDRHPGFRCRGGEGLPQNGFTTFVFEVCDPESGEESPNEFVIPLETALSIATNFFHNRRMSDAMSWFEL